MLTNTFFIIIEKWAFEDLHVGGFIPASTPLEEPFVESGLEVMSPHKSLAITQEVNDSIPEIGVVSTAWIGHLGKQVLLKRVRDETAKSVSKCLHSELRALASASMKAFETLHWADYSTNCDVSNAVKLCRSYLSTPSRRLPKANLASTSRAWKESSCNYESNPDRMQLATNVLGKQLIDTIKETRREPPHVSIL